MNALCAELLEYVPKWVAPNIITILGSIPIIVAYTIMISYDMTLTQTLPDYLYLLAAIGILTFITFDFCDGIQARRTGSSSPMGQLFDHGWDSLSWAFINLTVVSLLGFGVSVKSVLILYSFACNYYFQNLIESYTGFYDYNFGILSGTTKQFMVVTFNLIAFFFGGDVYQWEVSETWTFLPEILTNGFKFRDYIFIAVVYVGILFSIMLLWRLNQEIKGFKNYAIVFIKLGQVYGVFILMYIFNGEIKFVREHIALLYISLVFLISLMTSKLVVCLMTKMELSLINLEFLIFVPYFYFQSKFDGTAESEEILKCVFYATLFAMIAVWFKFAHCCIFQFREYLGIYCFTITKKMKKIE